MATSTRILEINLISAQGIKTPSSSLRRLETYAITWVDPSAKLRTRTDSLGGENPTWNDRFLFRVSDDFLSCETSAVSVEIFAVGFVKDVLIGTVRFLLNNCLKKNETKIPVPFSAVQIRRPSGRFQGVLNIAAAVHDSSEYSVLEKVSAVSFRDLMEKKEGRRRRRLSRGGSWRSRQSSAEDSDGAQSTTSSSSAASSTATGLKEWNCIREMAGKSGGGGGMLCGLGMQRRMRIPFYPSDQNLDLWEADSFDENAA